jgi:LysR family glycine cleavage system transcriptional activator
MVANWDGIDVDPLFPDTLVPVCARALIKGAVPTSASEIARYPLIHTSTRIDAWGDWLSAQGVQTDSRSEFIFGHFFMALEAARRGLGIALVPSILLQDLRRDGDLLILPAAEIPSAGFYYLLTHKNNRGDSAIGCFRTWIHHEASTVLDSLNLEPVAGRQA